MTKITILGAGFIGQMHANALLSAGLSRETPVHPELDQLIETAAGAELAEDVAARYGFAGVVLDDWRGALAGTNSQVFVNAGPNFAHIEPTIAAAEAGLHVFSEKPLAGNADDAHRLWKTVERFGVKHQCAFIHRFVPALRFARDLIQSGELGEVRHFRSQFLLDMREPSEPLSWRFSKGQAGGGATGDLGSHHIDAARFLVGEVEEICATTRTWTRARDGTQDDINDDSFSAIARLDQGAIATFEATRVATGHALTGRIEIDGEKGSLAFSMERMNELVVREPGKGPCIKTVTTGTHPYGQFFLPVGIQGAHPIGWRDCFAFQAYHFLAAVERDRPVAPEAATFRDGYRVAEIVDAMLLSADTGALEKVSFRRRSSLACS